MKKTRESKKVSEKALRESLNKCWKLLKEKRSLKEDVSFNDMISKGMDVITKLKNDLADEIPGSDPETFNELVMNELRNSFRPEFLNRLDEIIMFKPLTKSNIGGIVDLILAELNGRLADRQLTIALTPAAKQFVIDQGYDPVYGARPLRRYIQKNVETMAAKIILAGDISEGSTITIDSDGTQLMARKAD